MRSLRTICCAVLAAELALAWVGSANAIKVLMHGREDLPTFRDDPFVFAHLQEKYGSDNVEYLRGILAAPDGSSAAGYDVVFISSTMASGDTRDKYEDSPVGIVCDENALIHDNSPGNFMLSDAGGNQDNTVDSLTKINIVNPSHPLAAGLSGEVQVYKTEGGNWWQFGRGPLGPGVDLVANMVLPESDPPAEPQLAIFAAEKGAQLLGDGSEGSPATAAARRVFFFVSDFGFFDLTDDGVKLFDAAIDWAAAPPVSPLLGDYNNNGSVDAADYVLWRAGGPLANEAATTGMATQEDYDQWRARYGNSAAAASGSLSAATAVPEPAARVFALAALAACFGIRRSRSAKD